MKEKTFQILFAILALLSGIASFFSMKWWSLPREFEFSLVAVLLAFMSAIYGASNKNVTLGICSLFYIMFLCFVKRLFLNNDEEFYRIMTLVGPIFWVGVTILGFIFPWREEIVKLNKISFGALRLAGDDVFMVFYSSDSWEVYLGKVEYKNGKWKVYSSGGEFFFAHDSDRLFKKVEKMAQKKYPNGWAEKHKK